MMLLAEEKGKTSTTFKSEESPVRLDLGKLCINPLLLPRRSLLANLTKISPLHLLQLRKPLPEEEQPPIVN